MSNTQCNSVTYNLFYLLYKLAIKITLHGINMVAMNGLFSLSVISVNDDLVIMCSGGRHRVISLSLEKRLGGARCLSQDSAAISALWVTTAQKPGELIMCNKSDMKSSLLQDICLSLSSDKLIFLSMY